ncbi:MAG: ATP-binding cassette domain-containing protein [Flavisolibacter sp.]
MKIKLSNAGKRFNREWIFRNTDVEFKSTSSYAITGPNGSGKSTFLQCLGGMLQLSEGNLSYENNDGIIAPEKVFSNVSFCAPYLDVIEEMTLTEFFRFHIQFKKFLNGLSAKDIIQRMGLNDASDKQIRLFSSGMKQRVKLAQAIFSDSSILLLDEPCTNLDSKGIALYHELIGQYAANRLVIVSSNDEVEYSFCKEILSIKDKKIN